MWPFNKKPIVILGKGGHASELWAMLYTHYGINAKLVDKGDDFDLSTARMVFIGSGIMSIREKMMGQLFPYCEEYKKCGLILKAPSSYVCPSVRMNIGTVINHNAVIAFGSRIAGYVLINYGATIGHDTTIDYLSVVSPNASIGGSCKVGIKTYIGAGAVIRENLTIGDRVTIGMGAIVTKDIPDDSVVIGTNDIYTRDEWNAKTGRS